MICTKPGADGEFTLYDDDGTSPAYRNGSDPRTVWIRLRWQDATRTLTIESDARMRTWPGGTRVFIVEAADHPGLSQPIEFRGERVDVEVR